jgi:hypothetical protein
MGRIVMKNLLILVVLFLVAIAGFGFYRGWFQLSTNSTDEKPNATVTMDKTKILEDEHMAKDKVQGLGSKTKKNNDDWQGRAEPPKR